MVQELSAHAAPRADSVPAPIRAFGARRINLEMRVRLDEADKFTGLPRGSAKPFEYLTAFERAEPYLGLPAKTSKLIAWLVRQTEPQDWEEGSRPIAAPRAELQAEFLGGMSPRAVQLLNRRLWEAGIFVIRDDPQGRRYKNRDKRTGRLTKAFGFDLSPLVQRYEEFKKIAAAAEIERNHMRMLRRRATLARRGINQAVEELGLQGHDSEALRHLHRDAAQLIIAARACERSDELEVAVRALERREVEAGQRLRDLIKPVETSSMGEKNDAHSTSTTLISNHLNDTVIASRGSSQGEAERTGQNNSPPSKLNHLFPETLHITPATLVELAPRLAAYTPARTDAKDWPAIVEAAHCLSSELGINSSLWARACNVMGREYAAVALALVSTRPADHFTSGPGGYFAGMLRKFEKNPADLCLSRTLWKLKDDVWGTDGHKARRKIEHQRRIETSTGRSRHPDLHPAPSLSEPTRTETSNGGFIPVGAALAQPQKPATATVSNPPLTSTQPNSLQPTQSTWRPSPALMDDVQQIRRRLRQRQQQHNGADDTAVPRNSEES